jgi:hypothetical protein
MRSGKGVFPPLVFETDFGQACLWVMENAVLRRKALGSREAALYKIIRTT